MLRNENSNVNRNDFIFPSSFDIYKLVVVFLRTSISETRCFELFHEFLNHLDSFPFGMLRGKKTIV